MRKVVIGVGNPFRGDDGVGPAVLDRLGALAGTAELVPSDGEPASLVEAWEGAELAIVVDAVRTGTWSAGTVHRLEVLPRGRLLTPARPASTHALGVADAIALGTALGRLPARLTVFAVEGATFALGAPMSPPVAAAVDRVADAVANELTATDANPGENPSS